MEKLKKSAKQAAAENIAPQPLPVTVSRILPDGQRESFIIEAPPPRFRIDWEKKIAVPVEPSPSRWGNRRR